MGIEAGSNNLAYRIEIIELTKGNPILHSVRKGEMVIENIEEQFERSNVIRDLDNQIMIRKLEIQNLNKTINKAFNLAEIWGPKNHLTVDYSWVAPSNKQPHLGLDDAIRLSTGDTKQIHRLEGEIRRIRDRKKQIKKLYDSFEGIEQQIFLHRVLMNETQEEAAEYISISTRQLQRIEKKMKERLTVYT